MIFNIDFVHRIVLLACIQSLYASDYIHNSQFSSNDSTLGKCSEFLSLNNLTAYCPGRNDQCFIDNFRSRCYCDNFCTFDCCTDHQRYVDYHKMKNKKSESIQSEKLMSNGASAFFNESNSYAQKPVVSSNKKESNVENLIIISNEQESTSQKPIASPNEKEFYLENSITKLPSNQINTSTKSCSDIICLNGGICSHNVACVCPENYYGTYCELVSLKITKINNSSAKENLLHGPLHSVGSCEEFLSINNRTECCEFRDDNCFMNHYDSRCYCDFFCNQNSHYDCCPDIIDTCKIQNFQTTTVSAITFTTTTINNLSVEALTSPSIDTTFPQSLNNIRCMRNKKTYEHGEIIKVNCNECVCSNGNFKCSNEQCMINIGFMNLINSDDSTWKATNYSEFWGKTLRFASRHKLGTILENPNLNSIIFDETDEESYDFRENANGIKKLIIRNQKDCGASWAYSTIDVASDRAVNTANIAEPYLATASVFDLIACSTKDTICRSGRISQAWSYLNSFGITNENCLKINESLNGSIPKNLISYCYSDDKCTNENSSYYPVLKSGPAYIINTISNKNVMHEIKDHGPVQMVFKIYDDFFMYKSGIYSRHPLAKVADPLNPYHSVKVLGWGSEKMNGRLVKYWIAANSWGEEWGENGYFRIDREDKATEIGKYVYAAWGNYLADKKYSIF